ncbi:MAG: AAA family ATPase [Geminicoccaceae bacterium]|nr:AAA family ATPase [Geminicoccaceae bacterium]
MIARDVLPARASSKAEVARLLASIDRPRIGTAELRRLEEAWREPRAHVVGLTGPPGVGKSTLLSSLVRAWRARGRTVAVIAVDPSSRLSGGAILGDRTRLDLDPEDDGVFVRSMAARKRLGGLAAPVFATMVLLRPLFDIVLIETVGVGQSETEIADVADTVLLAIQPASGDSLQMIKAGIVEIPHIAIVTKADLGRHADDALKALLPVLRGRRPLEGWKAEALKVSASTGEGIERLVERIGAHETLLRDSDRLEHIRHRQACLWVEHHVRDEFGRRGLEARRAMLDGLRGDRERSPMTALAAILDE